MNGKAVLLFVAVAVASAMDTSSRLCTDNLPSLRCISDCAFVPGPICAPPRCSNIITTHKNHLCPSTIVPDRVCSHNSITIPSLCSDAPISRPACVNKEIFNHITVNRCGLEKVCPRFNRFIPNSCSQQCPYDCQNGPIIYSCGSKSCMNNVAINNVFAKNVHANNHCGSVHIAPPLSFSYDTNVGPHCHCGDLPLIHGCGGEVPINKVTVRNVIAKRIPVNNFCHCKQPALPLCAPRVTNSVSRLHCAIPPIITPGYGCEAPINNVKNVLVKNIPLNDCRQQLTSCIPNQIPYCGFTNTPIVTRGCGCKPPINKVAIRNVITKIAPKGNFCMQCPPPRCSNLIFRSHQGVPCVPNTCSERCCSPKSAIFIPDAPRNVPARTIIVRPDHCCQRDRCCNLKNEQNCCFRKHSCKQCCSECYSKKCQPSVYKYRCCENDPCCCKVPIRTITIHPIQKYRCCDRNSKCYNDNPCYLCDNYCVPNRCYKKQCCKQCYDECCKQCCEQCCKKYCEQCCSNKCHNKYQPSCYICCCYESDPCSCKKKCCNCFICKCYTCSCCQKKCKCSNNVKCCDTNCFKCYCCQNSKCC